METIVEGRCLLELFEGSVCFLSHPDRNTEPGPPLLGSNGAISDNRFIFLPPALIYHQ